MMRKLAILTLFLFPLFVFGQKWSQVAFKNNDGKNEKKWVYKVSGKFKDYEKRRRVRMILYFLHVTF